MRLFAAAFIALFFATPALAQTITPSPAPTGSAPSLTAAAAQGSGRLPSAGGIHWKGQAGLMFGGDDAGFLVGAGGEGRPFDNKQIEVAADLSLYRLGGSTGAYISTNGLYHFRTSDSVVDPFAGAGLGILADDGTTARLQIVGGLDFKKTARPLRLDLRLLLSDDNTVTLVTLGIGLGR
jgi:hypothetical protein